MKNTIQKFAWAVTIALVCGAPTSVLADCYVDYKAKRHSADLELHYGVMKISRETCSTSKNAQKVVSKRLAKDGWVLLTIVSSFNESELSSRQNDAGYYFLRY